MSSPNDVENIIFILTDQQRQDSLGSSGNWPVDTPNLDALVADGIGFERAYTPTAVCGPARASVLTGMFPFEHKFLSDGDRDIGYPTEIPDEATPYPLVLGRNGYNTGHVGKWHLGEQNHPHQFGLEGEYYPGWAPPTEHDDYLSYLRTNDLPKFDRSGLEDVLYNDHRGYTIGGVDDRPPEAHFTYYLAERAIERLERYGDEFTKEGTPFYLGLHFFGPHQPYFLPEEYYYAHDPDEIELPESSVQESFTTKPSVQRTYANRWGLSRMSVGELKEIIARYLGWVEFIDEQVGRVLDKITELGLNEKTAVCYSSDHGSFLTEHKLMDKGPMMYEDIYNVPLVLDVPGVDPSSDHEKAFVSLLDVVSTFLDLADVPVPDEYDGDSLFRLFDDENDWRNHIVTEFHGHQFPYSQRMIRTDRYKLVVNHGDWDELYDLEEDPHEVRNLICDSETAEVRETHYEKLYDELDTRGDGFVQWYRPNPVE